MQIHVLFLPLVSQTWNKELLDLREILGVYFANVGFPGGSAVKNPPAMQEMLVPSLLGRSPGEMAILCSILAWEMPWTEDPDGLSVVTNHHHHHHHLPMIAAKFGANHPLL